MAQAPGMMAAAPEDMAAAPEDIAAPDMAADQGYVIEIMVKADGTFAVTKAPMQMEAEEENAAGTGEEPADTYDSLGAAMKAVMEIIKANPIAASEQGQFEAGFGAKY